jgi:hypothetical protein
MLRRKPRTHFAWQTKLTSPAIQIFPCYPPSCWMPGTRSVGTRALADQIHKTAAASAARAESAFTTSFRLDICFRTRIPSLFNYRIVHASRWSLPGQLCPRQRSNEFNFELSAPVAFIPLAKVF